MIRFPRRTACLATSLIFLLGGCATEALNSAPDRPDAPWQPNVSAKGELLPGRHKQGLTLPAGYTLPSNQTITPRPADADISATHTYSLPELIDLAQSANPSTRQAWNTARDAALAVGITRTTYLPHLSATVVGGYAHQHNSGSNSRLSGAGNIDNIIDNESSQIGSLGNGGGGGHNSSHGEVQTLNMQWLLFDFGKREAVLNVAKQTQLATNILFTAAHQKVIYEVTLAFYTHAAAVARVTLIQQALENAKKVQEAAEMRLKQGQGTIVDVTQARQMTAQAELRLHRRRTPWKIPI